MSVPSQIVVATRNRKKLLEIVAMLHDAPVTLMTLDQFPDALEVEETGVTFGENAALKACLQARALRQWVLGEDSGLSVAALDGAPGVWSARFSGPEATDESNNRLLMERLEGVPPERRDAWYTCHACLSDPAGQIVARAEGQCRGRIVSAARGGAGFGYDPYFEIPEYGLTFAELGLAFKSILSHRARAFRQLRKMLWPALR